MSTGAQARDWPGWLVLACAAASIVVVATNHFRRGAIAFALTLLLAMVLRLLLPGERAGMLVVRRRSVDVLVLGALGVTTLVLALAVRPPS